MLTNKIFNASALLVYVNLSFTFLPFYLFYAFKSNYSHLFWRGAGGEAVISFGEGSVVRLFVLSWFILIIVSIPLNTTH